MTAPTKNGTVEEAIAAAKAEVMSAPATVDVTIHAPDVITLGIWTEYNTARLEYADQHPNSDAFTAKYYGALAVIKAGYFHIDGVDKLKALAAKGESEQRNVPLAVVAFVVRHIAVPIEEALDSPLALTYLNGL